MLPPKRGQLSAATADLQAQTIEKSDFVNEPVAGHGLEPHAEGRMKGFGDRLRWIRAGTGLSQVDLARKIRVSPRTLTAWESEKRRPHRSTLETLAKLIDVPIDELFAFIDSRRKLTRLPKQMRRWLDVPRISEQTTLADLNKLVRGAGK